MKKKNAVIAGVCMLGIFAFSSVAYGVVKDTDVDGLTDQSEETVYRTDAALFDTDGDKAGDGDEVLAGTNPLDPNDTPVSLLESLRDPGILGESEKFAWYFARATGILSFILLTLVTVFGLMISSRSFMTRILPGNALELHRTMSWLALFAVVLHFSSFFFDEFLRMSIVEVLIPFALERNSIQTTLGFDIGKTTALGIIAFYLIVMLILTSEFRAKMSSKLWRRLHYFSFVAYPLFLLHGVLSGTDSREWWMQAIYIGSATLVSIMIIIRIIFRNILPKIRARQSAQSSSSSQE